MARYSRTQYDDNLDAAKTAALRTDSAAREAQATGFYRDPIRGVTYNLNYNPRLLSQGHTVDPSTGQTIPGAAFMGDDLLGGGLGGGGGSSYHDRLLGQGLTVDPSTGHRIPGAFGGRGLTGATRSELQKRRLAERDVEALEAAFTSGEIGVGQYDKARKAMEDTYGSEALIHIPGWRKRAAGVEQLYEAQKSAALDAQSERYGLDKKGFKWNDAVGEWEVDKEWLGVQALQTKAATEAAKPKIELQKMERELAQDRYQAALDIAQVQHSDMLRQKIQPDVALAEFDKRVRAASQQYDAETRRINSGGVNAEAAVSPAAPVLTHPKLPTNVRISAEFPSVAQAGTALRPNEYGVVGGRLVRKTAQGILEEVK